MPNFAVQVRNLSKNFKINAAKNSNATLRDEIVRWLRSSFHTNSKSLQFQDSFWALRDVSFDIKMGEIVGIIGANGAGKSTLLKILSRITEPTSGIAEIHGRVGSLLEVGTGFHADLTGRENIYLSGAILGMSKKEIDRNFDEIVDFAEVERFIDTPVKHYSSGMFLRLGFAVAAHLEPEILLIDEVLAVGDLAFQRKCLGKMRNMVRQGRTLLFVSHNIAAVESLCKTALLFEHGRLVQRGETKEVVETYLSSIPLLCSKSLLRRTDRKGKGLLKFTDIQFLSGDGAPIEAIQSGEDLQISVSYISKNSDLNNIYMAIDIFEQTGQCMLSLCNVMVGTEFDSLPPNGRLCCRIERFPLSPGQYPITLFCRVNGDIADWVQQAALLSVEPGDFFGTGRLPQPTHGGGLVPQDWHVEEGRASIQ